MKFRPTHLGPQTTTISQAVGAAMDDMIRRVLTLQDANEMLREENALKDEEIRELKYELEASASDLEERCAP